MAPCVEKVSDNFLPFRASGDGIRYVMLIPLTHDNGITDWSSFPRFLIAALMSSGCQSWLLVIILHFAAMAPENAVASTVGIDVVYSRKAYFVFPKL